MNPSFHEAHRCMSNKLYAARTELYPSALMILKKPENTCGIVSWGISKACTVLLCFVSWKSSLCCAVLSCWVLSDSYAMPWTAAHQAPLFMGILQARILEWVAMPSSRGSSQPRDQTQASTLQVDSLPSEPPGKPTNTGVSSLSLLQRIFLIQELKQGVLHCRRFFTRFGKPQTWPM